MVPTQSMCCHLVLPKPEGREPDAYMQVRGSCADTLQHLPASLRELSLDSGFRGRWHSGYPPTIPVAMHSVALTLDPALTLITL